MAGMDAQAVVNGPSVAGAGRVNEGVSCRAAASRFGVAAATVIRWHDQRRSTGGYAGKAQAPTRGHTGSRHMRPQSWRCTQAVRYHAGRVAARAEPIGLDGRCTASSHDTGSRAKKVAHAIEQDCLDVLSQREEWFDGQLDLDRLVFIDEI